MVENIESRKYVYGALHLARAFDNSGHLKFETIIVNASVLSSIFVAKDEIERLTGVRYGSVTVGMLEKDDFLKWTKEILDRGGVVPDRVLEFEGLREYAKEAQTRRAATPN